MSNSNTFQPKWASVPGDTIIEILQEQKISISEFANKLNKTPEFVSDLINGYNSITAEIANQLAIILGASAEFWITREEQYRADLIYLDKLEKEKEKAWIKSLPTKDMFRFGWLNTQDDLLAACLNYFKVPSIEAWENHYNKSIELSAFRTSPTFSSELGAVVTWIRQGEIQSESIDCKPWNPEAFEKILPQLKTLTRKKSPKVFIPELVKLCAECGVAVVIVPPPGGCRASGVTKFINTNKALILLSFRYLSDDHFWFTFFHEVGHLLLHSNKGIFIDENFEKRQIKDEETEANAFASDLLIPHELHSQLSQIKGNKRNIISFATKAGVSPGIVVGQLQYYGYVDKKYLNGYKRRYTWDEIFNL